jgi:hypothetical protein
MTSTSIRTASSTRITGTAMGFAAAMCVVARLALSGSVFDRVWAEDGAVFLADARVSGFGSLFAEYSGYGHLAPRLLAFIGSWLPLAYYSLFAVLASAVIVGMLAAYVFTVARNVMPSAFWAAVAATALVLAPAYRVEALGNLASLQWFLMPAALWAIVDPRRTRVSVIVVVAAAATSPLTILLIPALFVTYGRGAWRSSAAIALAGGLAYQVIVLLVGVHSVANPVTRSPGAYVSMVFDILKQAGSTPWVPLAAGLLLIAVLLAVGLRGAWKDKPTAGFVVTSALFVVVPSVLNGSVQPRYVACGFVILVWAACLAGPALHRAVATMMVAVLAGAAAVTFVADPYRVSGPSWTDENNAQCTMGTHDVELSPEGWGAIPLPC